MEEKRGDEDECTWVSAVSAVGEEEKSEPYGGALHETPGQWRRDGGAPPRAVVLAVRGGEEEEGYDGGGCD